MEGRQHREDFTNEEVIALIQCIGHAKVILDSKLDSTEHKRLKQRMWEEIVNTIRPASMGVQRTVNEVKEKWKDLTLQVKKELHARNSPEVDGGNTGSPEEKKHTELILEVVGEGIFSQDDQAWVSSDSSSSQDKTDQSLRTPVLLGTQGGEQSLPSDCGPQVDRDRAREHMLRTKLKYIAEHEHGSKRRRKSRFTPRQIRTLLKMVSDNRSIVNSKQSNDITYKQKQSVWEAITEAVNAPDELNTSRTVLEVKKKWNDLKSGALQYSRHMEATHGDQYQEHRTKAGSEEERKIPAFYEIICAILAEKKHSWHELAETDSPIELVADWDVEYVRDIEETDNFFSSPCTPAPLPVTTTTSGPLSKPVADDQLFSPASSEHSGFLNFEGTQGQDCLPAATTTPASIVSRLKEGPKEASESGDALWCTYLREEIRLKRLQQEQVEADTKLKKTMTEYYMKKTKKLSD